MYYDLLGRVMELVHLDPFYAGTTTGNHRNSIYYAIKHGKCLPRWDGDELVGYCTYGFFTEDELEKDLWDGDEVDARADGPVLCFPKFQCRHGRREVISFVRDIQRFMKTHHPDRETGAGLRVYPSGETRNERWYRK